MYRIVTFLLLTAFATTPTSAEAQKSRLTSNGDAKSPTRHEVDMAIETIATSTNREEVNAADKLIRTGGLVSIHALLPYLDDKRSPPTNYLTRAISGDVDMRHHSFWLIQDILEDHESKLDASYSPLRRDTVRKWIAKRKGMSLDELRRDACIGAFATILKYAEDYPSFNPGPVLKRYVIRLAKLDAKVHGDG